MSVKFDYEDIGNGLYGKISRPVAKVTFQSPNFPKAVDIWMIVDTGADFTVLPQHFAEKLRISLERDCIKDSTVGIGGEQSIYFSKIRITAKIGNITRQVPLAFADSNEIPALMGRLGFLETFDTEFLKKHVVIFKD